MSISSSSLVLINDSRPFALSQGTAPTKAFFRDQMPDLEVGPNSAPSANQVVEDTHDSDERLTRSSDQAWLPVQSATVERKWLEFICCL